MTLPYSPDNRRAKEEGAASVHLCHCEAEGRGNLLQDGSSFPCGSRRLPRRALPSSQ